MRRHSVTPPKVRSAARTLRTMALVSIAIIPVHFAWVTLAAGRPWVTHIWGATGILDHGLDDFDIAHPWEVAMVQGPSLFILAYGLWRLVRLMRLYEAGHLFDPSAAGHLQAFSRCLFLSQLIDFGWESIVRVAMWWFLHIHNVPLRFSTVALWAIFVSLLLARVLSAAYLIAADNEQIV
jgi:hypothetical protein